MVDYQTYPLAKKTKRKTKPCGLVGKVDNTTSTPTEQQTTLIHPTSHALRNQETILDCFFWTCVYRQITSTVPMYSVPQQHSIAPSTDLCLPFLLSVCSLCSHNASVDIPYFFHLHEPDGGRRGAREGAPPQINSIHIPTCRATFSRVRPTTMHGCRRATH